MAQRISFVNMVNYCITYKYLGVEDWSSSGGAQDLYLALSLGITPVGTQGSTWHIRVLNSGQYLLSLKMGIFYLNILIIVGL